MTISETILDKIKDLLSPNTVVETVSILSGDTDSTSFGTKSKFLVAIKLPSTFTGSSITLKGKISNDSSFETITNTDGSTYSIAVGNGNAIPIDPVLTIGFKAIQIISGSSEGGDREIIVALKSI